jgi:hypothetical protein
MALFRRSKKAFQQFKDWAQNTRMLTKGKSLSGGADGEGMVYAVNDVYLEIGQGGMSPMRGWGAIIFVFGLGASFLGLGLSIWFLIINFQKGTLGFGAIIFLIVALFSVVLAVLIFGSWLVASFFSVVDPLVRFDHKRGKVWMWTGRGPIEMEWRNLTPMIQATIASAVSNIHIHRGLYVELGSDGLPLLTKGVPHTIQCGQVSAADEGVLPAMEYVRRYMESGMRTIYAPATLLQSRPKWWAMINFFGLAQTWIDYWPQRKNPGIKAPWFATIAMTLFFPVAFPMQFTNWVALRFAPIAKWPKEIQEMHEADLRALQMQVQQKVERTPVMRLNGEMVESTKRIDKFK